VTCLINIGGAEEILNVDLTTCRTTELETKAYADKYIGGQGNGKPEVADPEALREISRHTVKLNTRFGSTISPQIRSTGKTHLLEVIGQGNCYLCRLDCPRRLMRAKERYEDRYLFPHSNRKIY
jgi:hypothetical protein